MKWIMRSLPVLVFAIAATSANAEDPRGSMKSGHKSYAASDYEQAAQAFEEARSTATDRELDPAPAAYNLGNTLFRQGLLEEAADAYVAARETQDLDLQQKSFFNEGNIRAAEAMAFAEQGQLDGAVESIDQSLGLYEKAMMLRPSDEDPKINFELALKAKEQLEQMQQQQQNQQQDQQEQQDEKEEQEQEQQQQSEQSQDQDEQGEEQDQQQEQEQNEQEQAAPQKPSEEMTEEEAEMLLDAMRQEEEAQRNRMRIQMGQPVSVDKDW